MEGFESKKIDPVETGRTAETRGEKLEAAGTEVFNLFEPKMRKEEVTARIVEDPSYRELVQMS